MSGLLVTLRGLRDTLAEAERRVADLVLHNPEEVPSRSVQALAKAANVSTASVSRLAKRAGCRDFRELKIRIAQESAVPLSLIYDEIADGDSNDEIVRKVFAGNMKGLEDTLKILDANELLRTAELISRCNRTAFFGIASSGHIARDAAFRLSLLGTDAQAYTNHVEALGRAMNLRKGDLALGISHSGRSVTPVRALRLAAENGATTVGISNYPNTPLAKASDIYFCTAFRESRVRAAALSSRVCQVCVVDALYLLVARSVRDLSHTEQINDMTEKDSRFPLPRRRRRRKR